MVEITAGASGPTKRADTLTLTLRLHDELEAKDPKLSASWAVIKVERADLGISEAAFIEKYVRPALVHLTALKLAKNA